MAERDGRFQVLLVEDDQNIQKACQEILQEMGIFKNVVLAKDGTEAYSKFLNQRFDLLVSDIVIPKLDALKLLSLIRLKLNGRNFPKIVLISGMLTQELLKESVKQGVKHILAKPFSSEEFKKKINEVLHIPGPN